MLLSIRKCIAPTAVVRIVSATSSLQYGDAKGVGVIVKEDNDAW